MLDPSSTHAKTSLCNIDLLIILVVGLVAGWLAGQTVRAIGFGISVTIIGIIGALHWRMGCCPNSVSTLAWVLLGRSSTPPSAR